MSDNTEVKPDTEATDAQARHALRDLDVKADDAAQVKAGAKRREDPCAGGE